MYINFFMNVNICMDHLPLKINNHNSIFSNNVIPPFYSRDYDGGKTICHKIYLDESNQTPILPSEETK